jgi:hypothetical protein
MRVFLALWIAALAPLVPAAHADEKDDIAKAQRAAVDAPPGEYVILQFDTQFENRSGVVETVTPMREKDGSWRVSGYFIK